MTDKKDSDLPPCCQGSEKHPLKEGVFYALIPHTGCIAFLIASIVGATAAMSLFKPLLMNRYFFHYLILLSLGFATISSGIYLRKSGMLSIQGARKKWGYLSVMYGSTVGINLLLFLVVFPMLANVGSAAPTGNVLAESSALTMAVDIPCPGHAPLITNELKTIEGIESVTFSFPNKFAVIYDPEEASKSDMLALDVFTPYPATVLSEDAPEPEPVKTDSTPVSGCGCGGR